MNENNMISDRDKILKAMDAVYDKLIEFKKRMNSEMVVMRDGKIIRIKP
ncbi:MAG: hypothetical protein IPM42_08025 [Saprospiraceae bacterium]|nr:hypothetical protein [Saprospiraceae bacterium]